jgi:hypothetical protein
MALLPYLCNYTALFLSAAMLMYFVTENFAWLINNMYVRFIMIAMAILIIPSSTYEVWHNITSFQWWSGLFLFFICLQIFHENELPKSIYINIYILFIGLSTPLILILAGLYFLTIISKVFKSKDIKIVIKKYYISLMSVSLPLIIQAISFFNGDRIVKGLSIKERIVLPFKIVFNNISYILYPFWPSNENTFIIHLIIGLFLFTVLLTLSLKKKLVLCNYLYAFLCIFLISATLNKESSESMLYRNSGGWYLFIPQFVFAFTVFYVLYDLCINKSRRIIVPVSMFCIYICTIIIINYNLPVINIETTDMYRNNIEYFDPKSETRLTINTPYIGWPFTIPFNIGGVDISYKSIGTYGIDNFSVVKSHVKQLDKLQISGWILDEVNDSAPQNIFFRYDGIYYAVRIVKRPDIVKNSNNSKTEDSGFFTYLPMYDINGSLIQEWEFIVLCENGEEYYSVPLNLDLSLLD